MKCFQFFAVMCFVVALTSVNAVSQELKAKEKEFACMKKLDDVRELAKNGCNSQVQTSIRTCLAAGVAIGVCATEPTKVTCFGAAIALAECDNAAKVRKECRAKENDWINEIKALKEGECFAAIGKNGECIFICEKRGPTFEMVGMLDLTKIKPSDAFRYFPK